MVGIICPTPVGIGLKRPPKLGVDESPCPQARLNYLENFYGHFHKPLTINTAKLCCSIEVTLMSIHKIGNFPLNVLTTVCF